MTTVYSNHNTYAEQLYKQNEMSPKYPNPTTKTKQFPNPSYRNVSSYYDTPVQNSHLYPNLVYIRPYNIEDIRPKDVIYKTIDARKKYALGPYVMTNRSIELWD